jgi:hypothetical protein
MLPPNLHEYIEEVGSAIWKFLKDEGQGDCIVHEKHMFVCRSRDQGHRL